MALIDELEAKQLRKRDVGARFTKAALDALTCAETPAEFDTAWSRVIENFGSHFDREAAMPQLREMVLELASRGTIVPRIATEGVGPDLLQRVVALRNSIEPESTGPETLRTAVAPVAHPLPEHWCWASLEVLTNPIRRITYGILMPGPEQSRGPLYVKVRNMKNGVIDVPSLPRTTPEIYAKYARAALAKGDLLMSIRGSFGGVALVPDEIDGANITQDSARIAPLEGVDRHYLLLMLRSPLCQRYFLAVAKGAAVQGINIADVRRTPVPLPPLAEQKRIVTRVDSLMKLCDELEPNLRRAEDRASKLVEAVVQELVE
jgi:type I restriction enzyme, S subunit